MIRLIAPKRDHDSFGSGAFGARRSGGTRQHNGQDYSAVKGSVVLAPVAGKVMKLGYPYANDLSYRYVEIKDGKGRRWRLFYVDPTVELGQVVSVGVEIGTVQDLTPRYVGITNHVHLEIISPEGDFLDPNTIKTGH